MHRHTMFWVALLFIACIAGCGSKPQQPRVRQPELLEPVPFPRQGTVSEFATLSGATNVRVSGYSLVIGLGNRGDTGAPPNIEKYIANEIAREGIGFHSTGTPKLKPERIIRDRDTAVVWVTGTIPPLAPIGTRFDLRVDALLSSDTSTLDGGHLMDTKMFVGLDDLAVPMGGTPSVAVSIPSQGDLFINPFLEPDRSEDAFLFRTGRILNGGRVTKSMDIRLELKRSDWTHSRQIADAINTRFKDDYPVPARGRDSRFADRRGSVSGQPAKARDNRVIDLSIPMGYRDDYMHFLELVMHLPLSQGQGVRETRARELIQYMEAPGADCPSAALVLEAMGKGILPILKTAYTSKNEEASYHCAVTGMRLGDASALSVITYHATKADSLFRQQAMRELSRYPQDPDARIALENLLDDEKDNIRILAYECLIKMGWSTRIRTVPITDKFGQPRSFSMDLVQTRGKYIIYATQSGRPRMALFGPGMPVEKNIFFRAPDGLLVIDGKSEPVPSMAMLGVNNPGGRLRVPEAPPEDDAAADAGGASLAAPVEIPKPAAAPVAVRESDPQPAEMLKGPVLVMDRILHQRDGRRSPMYQVPANVRSLVQALGTPTDKDDNNQVRGMGLTYGQVVNVMYRMCRQGDIQAKFVLQDVGDNPNIVDNASTMERPDTPE